MATRAATAAATAAGMTPGDTQGPVWFNALAARRHVLDRFQAWAATHRDPARALLWLHAPSVGEGLQVRPIIEQLRRAHPRLQVAYTHFSPSAAPLARSFVTSGLVDVADYLPFDTPDAADALLAVLKPRALVFGKLDVWPILVERAKAHGVRVGLVSATLAARAGRRSPLARGLLHAAYAALDAVGAIAALDAERLRALGVRAEALTITGDAGYDQVWARAATAAAAAQAALPAARDRSWTSVPTLVAGSTWPADERVLLPAWHAVRARGSRSRLLIAPHQPTESHLRPIERWAGRRGVSARRLGALSLSFGASTLPELILVDRVGVLADLYTVGDLAYVGGGFHRAGVHSVLEPAACGVPVLVGPRAVNNRDAALLVAAGGAHLVRTQVALAARLTEWIGDPALRRAAGAHARAVVHDGLGAADRSAALVERLLDPSAE